MIIKKNLNQLSNFSINFLETFTEYCEIIGQTAINPYSTFLHGPDIKIIKKYYLTINNLNRCGYLKKQQKNKSKGAIYSLSPKAKRILAVNKLKSDINKKLWDKNWYILIFDIPEKKRYYRDHLRRSLSEIGFYQLQKSVWLFPYDVIKYLYELLPGFREGDWFHYMRVDKINKKLEKKLIKLFNLKIN